MIALGLGEPAVPGASHEATTVNVSEVGAQLFPLPSMKRLGHEKSLSLNSKERRGVLRDCDLGIDSLNWLAGSARRPLSGRASSSTASRVHRLHEEVQDDVEAATLSWYGRGPRISSQAAIAKLLRGRGVYSQPANAGMVPLNPQTLSVPVSLDGAPSVLAVAPAGESDLLRDFEKRMLRSPEEVAEMNQQLGEARHYVDPGLRNRRRYANFIRKLCKVGLVSFSRTCRCRIGVFAVSKKNGSQRLIIDARPANRLFLPPPGVSLLTGEGLARMEVEIDDDAATHRALGALRVALGVADVSDCFHRLRFGPELQELKKFFAYPPILAGDAGVTEVDGVHVDTDALLFPIAESLPMGWAWSLYFAQCINEHQLSHSMRLVRPLVMSDRGPPLVFRPASGERTTGSYVYVDNLGVLSDDVPLVGQEIGGAAKHFNSLGLAIHEMEVTDVLGVALGIEVDVVRYETSTEHQRWWTLRLALQVVLKRPKIAGWELEFVLGHMTFVGLMSREVLSCFHVIYRYIQSSYWTRRALALSPGGDGGFPWFDDILEVIVDETVGSSCISD